MRGKESVCALTRLNNAAAFSFGRFSDLDGSGPFPFDVFDDSDRWVGTSYLVRRGRLCLHTVYRYTDGNWVYIYIHFACCCIYTTKKHFVKHPKRKDCTL